LVSGRKGCRRISAVGGKADMARAMRNVRL
jgi:hypothetical protein